MARIKIDSKQIFENHEESFSEEHDSEIILLEDGFKILYDNCEVSFDGEKVFVKNNNMFLEIVNGEKTLNQMNTPYGTIDLEVIGDMFESTLEPFCFKLRYFIRFGNTEQYVNELQIMVIKN